MVATLLLACGPDAPTIDRTPGVVPTSTYFELRVIGGDRTLQALAERAGPAARPFVVGSVRDLIDGVIALPGPVRGRVRGDGELRVLATSGDDGLELAVAVPFDAAGLDTLEPGGPRGTSRPGGAANLAVVPATADSPALLIAAASADHLAATLPYLAFAAFDSKPEGLHARFPERRFAEDLRPWLERMTEDLVRQGRASIASERARRDRPPELGDPEVVLDRLGTLAEHLGALAADLGATEISLTTDAAGTHLRLSSALSDSPLTDALTASRSFPLDAAMLPEGTAVALTLADPELLSVALELAGDRLDDTARDELRSWANTWPSGPRTIALGAAPGRFVWARAHTTGESANEATKDARWTTLPITRAWADALGGCETSCTFEPHADRLSLGVIPSRTLANDPDASRALRGDAHFALVLDGARAATWLDPSRPLTPPAVVVVRLTHTSNAVVLTLDATPDALPPLVSLTTSFAE